MRITGIMGESYKKGCKNSENKVRIIGQIVKNTIVLYMGLHKNRVFTGEGIFYEEDHVKWPVGTGGSGERYIM